jgi:hypothetical protein
MAEIVEGLADLDRMLGELPQRTGKAVLRRVGLAALKPFVETVRGMAPVDEDPTSTPKRKPGTLRDSYHAGTKLNKTQARNVRREGKSSVEVYAGTNDIAGVQTEFGNDHQPAQPHARPAWAATKERVLEGVVKGLWTEISKAKARLVKRTP